MSADFNDTNIIYCETDFSLNDEEFTVYCGKIDQLLSQINKSHDKRINNPANKAYISYTRTSKIVASKIGQSQSRASELIGVFNKRGFITDIQIDCSVLKNVDPLHFAKKKGCTFTFTQRITPPYSDNDIRLIRNTIIQFFEYSLSITFVGNPTFWTNMNIFEVSSLNSGTYRLIPDSSSTMDEGDFVRISKEGHVDN